MFNGCLPICPKCGTGRLREYKGIIFCPGYWFGEKIECNFKTLKETSNIHTSMYYKISFLILI